MGQSPYQSLRRNAVLDALAKFSEAPSKTIARMLKRDNPELFKDIEDARNLIRIYRGKSGKRLRERVKLTKYYTP